MERWMKERIAEGFRERYQERREATLISRVARDLHEATLPFRDVRVTWERLDEGSRAVYVAQATAVIRTHYVLPRGS